MISLFYTSKWSDFMASIRLLWKNSSKICVPSKMNMYPQMETPGGTCTPKQKYEWACCYHWGCWAYQVYSNDDPRLTLTYLTSRSNLLPNAFEWEIVWKVGFLNTGEAKVITLTWYVKTNETIAINKFQRSRLTFAPSAKVTHIVVQSIYIKT